MGESIINLFLNAATSCVSWFDSIIESSGLMPLVLGCITVYFTVRFFIYPFVGNNGIKGRGSDQARRKEDDDG